MQNYWIKNIPSVFVIVFGISMSAFPQKPNDLEPWENVGGKLKYAGFHEYKGNKVPYKIRIPDPFDSTKNYPIMIALNGSGGAGNVEDPDQIRTHWFANSWVRDSVQEKYPHIFILPGRSKGQGGWGEKNLETVNDLVDSIARKYNADTNRIYICGLSMGGGGTWRMIMQYPNKYAAGIPFAGRTSATKEELETIKHVPIWAFHGTKDHISDINNIRPIYEKFTELGRPPVYTDCKGNDCSGMTEEEKDQAADTATFLFSEYKDGGHVITKWLDWDRLIPWVFAQSRDESWTGPTATSKKSGKTIDNKQNTILRMSGKKSTVDNEESLSGFESGTYTLNGYQMGFELFVPRNYDSKISYPLVVTLHGANRREGRTKPPVTSAETRLWAQAENQNKYPCFILTPQAKTTWTSDVPRDVSRENSAGPQNWNIDNFPIPKDVATYNSLVDTIVDTYSIDKKRLYITGLSMGGAGTWNAILRYPNKYAAAVPIAGTGDPSHVNLIMHTPIWAFHGRDDDVVSVNNVREIMRAFEANGREVIFPGCNGENCDGMTKSELDAVLGKKPILLYTELEGVGHAVAAGRGPKENPQVVDWLFSQTLQPAPVDTTPIKQQ